MKNQILITMAFVSLILMACKKSDTNGAETPSPAPGPGPGAVEVSDISSLPNFETQLVVSVPGSPDHAAYVESRFGQSCQVQRNVHGEIISYRDRKGFDSSVREGDTSFVSLQISNQSGARKMDQKYQVRSKSVIKTRMIRTTLSMVLPQAGGEILTTPISEFENCIYIQNQIECHSGGKTLDEHRPFMTVQGYDYLRNHPDSMRSSCRVHNPTDFQTKAEVGRLKLQDGTSIPAFKTTEVFKGPIFCGQQLIGEGEVVVRSVTSLAVKALPGIPELEGELQSCGGAQVARTQVISVGGKVIDSFRFEQKKPSLK